MIISCPSCGASFKIKLEALGSSGRKVKCGKCAHQWHALPDGSSAAAEPTGRKAAPAPRLSANAPPAPAETARRSRPDPAPDDGEMPRGDVPRTVPKPVAAPEPVAAPTPMANPPAFAEAEPVPGAEPHATSAPAEDEDEPQPQRDVPAAPSPFMIGQTAPVTNRAAPYGEGGGAPEPERMSDMADGPARRSLAGRITLAALAAAAAVVILAGGAIFLQPQITSVVPAAASLYAKMGLQTDIPGLGLKIVEPVPRKLIEGDDEILEVVGEIRNETKKPLQIPVMKARLLDGDGAPLEVWHFRAAKPQIAPGESVQYKTEFRNPPNRADRLDITFTRQGPATESRPEMAGKRPPLQKLPQGQTNPDR